MVWQDLASQIHSSPALLFPLIIKSSSFPILYGENAITLDEMEIPMNGHGASLHRDFYSLCKLYFCIRQKYFRFIVMLCTWVPHELMQMAQNYIILHVWTVSVCPLPFIDALCVSRWLNRLSSFSGIFWQGRQLLWVPVFFRVHQFPSERDLP